MDIERLRAAAASLRAVLLAHAGESHAVDVLHEIMKPLLDQAEAGTITAPIAWSDVPGDRPFLEGDYADFPDVEDAYSRFKLVVTGSEHLVQEALR